MMRMENAADHGGFCLKEDLAFQLKVTGPSVVEFGAHRLTPDADYPDHVVPVGQSVVTGISVSRCRLGMTVTRSSSSGGLV